MAAAQSVDSVSSLLGPLVAGIDPLAFAAFMAERLPRQASDGPVSSVHTTDLQLSFACLSNVPGAHERFEYIHFSDLERVVRRVDRSPAFVSEVIQKLREKLYVRRKLEAYQGRGPLGAWLRVAALRTALNLKAAQKPHAHRRADDNSPPGALVDDDFELKLLRARYQNEFKQALAAALKSLSSRERAALRLRFFDGLNVDQIGKLYGVHRATAARWIATAREKTSKWTAASLRRKLDLTVSEAESLVRAVGNCDAFSSGMLVSES